MSPPPIVCGLLVAMVGLWPSNAADWTLWGGNYRNFQTESPDRLADSFFPLWERNLGDGYSAIAILGNTLYTTYRRDAAAWQFFTDDQEVVVALDATTGRTKWEFAYDVEFRSDQGSGPHVMPQVVGELVFSVGAAGKLHALKAATGELVWQLDLYQALGARRPQFGYSSHPLPYRDKLIVVGGGKGRSVAAIEQKTGRVVWAAHTFRNAYSSPVLITIGGRDQVVVLAAQQIMGLDPANGEAVWVRRFSTDPAMAFCSTPLWDPATRVLIYSGAYGVGSTALRITGSSTVVQLWRENRLQSLFSNMLLHEDTVYMSKGYHGPSFLTAVDIQTGRIRWSARGFPNANFLMAGGKLFILDEDGWFSVARPNKDGSLQVLSKARVLSHNAWTVPTLAGTTLYLRDRKIIRALSLKPAQQRL